MLSNDVNIVVFDVSNVFNTSDFLVSNDDNIVFFDVSNVKKHIGFFSIKRC
jgi:hypothetical protein